MASRGVRLFLALAALLLSGCVTPTFNDLVFERAWAWASHDGFELDFAAVGSESVVRLYADEDGVLKTRGNAFEVGHRHETDSAVARTILLEARAEGLLKRRDQVLSCWQLDPGWRLGGSPDRKTGLIVAASREGSFVLVRGHASWERYEVRSHLDESSSPVKCALVVATCVPAWALSIALDSTIFVFGACASREIRGEYLPDWRPEELRAWARRRGRG